MFAEAYSTLDQKIAKRVRQFAQLSNRLEALSSEVDRFLEELGISEEQLNDLFSNSTHFSPAEWEELQNARAEANKRLEERLATYRISQKKKEINIPISPHWIQVR